MKVYTLQYIWKRRMFLGWSSYFSFICLKKFIIYLKLFKKIKADYNTTMYIRTKYIVKEPNKFYIHVIINAVEIDILL